MNRFDATSHTYYIADRPAASVTQIINRVYGRKWMAADWYMERGTAVHACAAMIGRGEEFDCDPRIEGQVAACRAWYAAFKPTVWEIETAHYDDGLRFAGTPDLVCCLNRIDVVVDWKSSTTDLCWLQLTAYALLTGRKYGMVVELKENGTYKCGKLVAIGPRERAAWMATMTVYGVMVKHGINSAKGDQHEDQIEG